MYSLDTVALSSGHHHPSNILVIGERKREREMMRGAERAASPLIELVPLKRHLGSYFRK